MKIITVRNITTGETFSAGSEWLECNKRTHELYVEVSLETPEQIFPGVVVPEKPKVKKTTKPKK